MGNHITSRYLNTRRGVISFLIEKNKVASSTYFIYKIAIVFCFSSSVVRTDVKGETIYPISVLVIEPMLF